MTTLYIKNMVCPRCIAAVETMLRAKGFDAKDVSLGTVHLADELDEAQRQEMARSLHALGFELLEDAQTVMVENLRRLVIEWVRIEGEHPKLSDYLQEAMLKDYSTLSKLFSSVRGVTIERYCIMQRIEYAKELLFYAQKNINEIAYIMGYSSAAHFCKQFKQETGLSPSQFKSSHDKAARKSLDSI